MIAYISKWLTPQNYNNEAKNRKAQALFQIHVITLGMLLFAIVISYLVGYRTTPLTLALGAVLILVSLWLNRLGHLHAASLTFIFGFMILITYLDLIGQGIHDEANIVYVILVMLASLLFSPQLFALTTALAIGCVWFVTWAELNNWIDTGLNDVTTYFDFLVVAMILAFTAVIMQRIIQILNTSEQKLLTQTKALEESEARWRSFAHDAPITILNTSLDGIIQYINIEPDDPVYVHVIGKNVLDFAAPEEKAKVRQALASVITDKQPVHYEARGVNVYQETVWFDNYVGPVLENGRITSLLFNIIDITDKKNIQLQLNNSERRLRNFITQSTEAIWMIEYKPPIPVSLPLHEQAQLVLDRGVISECNEAGRKVYGFTSIEDAIGVPTSSLRAQKDLTLHFQAAIDFIEADYKITGKEFRHTLPNGKFVYVLTNSVVIVEDGCLIANWGTEQDITALKEAEQTLRSYAAELERSNNELQEFAYIASHDLQEPLRKIQTFADRLAERYAQNLEGRGLEYLQRMEDAAARMQRLIEDLLAYSRVATKGRPFTLINLNQIIQTVLSDLEPRIKEEKAVIHVDNLPAIIGDETQLTQLFQNLISNAIKFHKDGIAPLIHIQGQLEDYNCVIKVADNGIGFDEKYLDRIFNMFQRLHARTSYEGTGVGLAVCRRIVERHGGKIEAKSQPGEGATFIIYLPIQQKEGEQDA